MLTRSRRRKRKDRSGAPREGLWAAEANEPHNQLPPRVVLRQEKTPTTRPDAAALLVPPVPHPRMTHRDLLRYLEASPLILPGIINHISMRSPLPRTLSFCPSTATTPMEQLHGEVTPSPESPLAPDYNKLTPYTNSVAAAGTAPTGTVRESRAPPSAVRTMTPVAHADLCPTRWGSDGCGETPGLVHRCVSLKHLCNRNGPKT